MSTEKKVVKCVPKLPKSHAREYNLKTFMKELEDSTAVAVWHDNKFKPVVNEEGWCAIHANLHSDVLELPANSMEEVECGFDIMIPPGHELHFRQVRGSKWLLHDASNPNFRQRRVRVNIINLGTTATFIRHGDLLGEVCVRPTGNIPITLETEQ